MSDILSEYQKWKQQGQDLRNQARQAMEARFNQLLGEAVKLSEEYKTDFGVVLKPPAPVTSFRYKSGGKAKAKKADKGKAAASTPAAPAPKQDARVPGLLKRLEAAKQKLDKAKAAGGSTKNLEDRIYEIEDELKLAGHSV